MVLLPFGQDFSVTPKDQESLYISIIPIDGCDGTIAGSFVAKVMVY